MSYKILYDCLGCGACEMACPTEAIAQSMDFRVAYVVDPLLCNDCAECVPVCPVETLVPDPDWAVCMGRGCPLTSSRFTGWGCSQGSVRCETCGAMLWQAAQSSEWVCPRCDEGRKVICPKVRKSETSEICTDV